MQATRQEGAKTIPMINSFLNLCRVCPVPTDDKVNSEYKRNFTWHDGYQAAKVDVIKNAPSLPHSTVEPPLPRKKKHPEFAYRTHELLFDCEEGESSDSQEIVPSAIDSRARSEDRNGGKSRGSPRSRSADSSISRRLRTTQIPEDQPPKAEEREAAGKRKPPVMAQSYPPTSATKATGTPNVQDGVPKTTEYRSQFVAWTRLQQEENAVAATARKSASMGLIAQARKETVDGDTSSAVCGVRPEEADSDDAALDAVKRGRIKKTEYKAKFRPFSAYTYVDGNWKKSTRLIKDNDVPPDVESNTWYSEVVERLKKADQYKVRSHRGLPFYGPSDQALPPELLSHVRDRSILSPVSAVLASRTWKDDRLVKEKARSTLVAVHHPRKEKKEPTDGTEQPKGSPKKKSAIEKTTVRPKSAEPVVPVARENKSPKRTRPRAPKDLPVHGHGDLSGRKKTAKKGVGSPHGKLADKASPVGSKSRAVPRAHGAETALVNDDDGKVWLKPAAKDEKSEEETMVNGYADEIDKADETLVNGVMEPESEPKINGHADIYIPSGMTKLPMRVPLTTVKSPEEVTGVRSPDPESWTVPLEISRLQWMDGKTPDGSQTKTPPVLLTKQLKESSLVGQGQRDVVFCDPGSASTGESVDL